MTFQSDTYLPFRSPETPEAREAFVAQLQQALGPTVSISMEEGGVLIHAPENNSEGEAALRKFVRDQFGPFESEMGFAVAEEVFEINSHRVN